MEGMQYLRYTKRVERYPFLTAESTVVMSVILQRTQFERSKDRTAIGFSECLRRTCARCSLSRSVRMGRAEGSDSGSTKAAFVEVLCVYLSVRAHFERMCVCVYVCK